MNLDGLDPVIIAPALAAGILVTATHVPLGQQVLKRGIIFIDLAIAQIAALGVLLAYSLGFEDSDVAVQATAFGSALLGALMIYQCERRWSHHLEAIIGSVFVLAATAGILLLANNPHGGEHLKDLLVGQILWVNLNQLLPIIGLYVGILAAWYGLRAEHRPALFYILFSLTVTASVQLVGIYLVFATLIIPALAAAPYKNPGKLTGRVCQWPCYFSAIRSSFRRGDCMDVGGDWISGVVAYCCKTSTCGISTKVQHR